MGSVFTIEEPQKSASMLCIIHRRDSFAVGWCWLEKVTVVLLDVLLTGGHWMPLSLALAMQQNLCCFSHHPSGMKTLRTRNFLLAI